MTPDVGEPDLRPWRPRPGWTLVGVAVLVVLAAALLPAGEGHEVPTIQLDVTADDNGVPCSLDGGDCWFDIVQDGETLSGDSPDLTLERGATVEVTFENAGSFDHSFEVGAEGYGDGGYGGAETIGPGESDSFTFQVPWDADDEGLYWCKPHGGSMEGTALFEGGNTAPTLAVDAPGEGATVEGVVEIAGTAGDADGDAVTVEVRVPPDGTWQAADGSDEWTHAWNTTRVANGDHTIRVRATDQHGFETVVERTVQVDNPRPPTVTVDAPAEGAQVTGNVTVSGTARDPDDDLDRVEVRLPPGDGWQAADGLAGWSITWNTTGLERGTHTLWVRAVDAEGLSARANVTVELVDPSRPRVTVASPVDGAAVDGVVAVDGTAEDPEGELSRVEVRVDGGPWRTATGTTSWNLTIELAPGDHRIEVRAVAGERTSPAATVLVTVPSSDGEDGDATAAPGPVAAPRNVTVSSRGDGYLVSWDPVPGATAYRVQRDTGDGFEQIARTTGTSYEDGTAPDEGVLIYRTVAVGPDGTAVSEPAIVRGYRDALVPLPLWATVVGWATAAAAVRAVRPSRR